MTGLRFFLLLFLLLTLLSGCGGGTTTNDGKAWPKKLYLDANLEFTLTLPKEWSHRFITTPVGSAATYAILWQSAEPEENSHGVTIEVEVTTLLQEAMGNDKKLVNTFQLAHPGFTSTAVRPLEDVLYPTLELMGHTSLRTYQVFFIQTPKRTYQLSFSALPEKFEPNRALFDQILASFAPLD